MRRIDCLKVSKVIIEGEMILLPIGADVGFEHCIINCKITDQGLSLFSVDSLVIPRR
jgi:hypothetical protein